MTPRDVAVGASFAGAVAAGAYRAHALTAGGARAAFMVGSVTYATGGLPSTLVLLAFFGPSVALSRVGRARKRLLVDIGKGGPRDAVQVAANGGIATACAVAAVVTNDDRWRWAFAGAYAAATADTWGTEVGTLARGTPRSILTGRRIAPGMSGGITAAGTLAEIGGALWIAVTARALGATSGRFVPIVAVALAGIGGATADSILGATVQELRHCDACGKNCETDPHHCGAPTRRVRGIAGFSNDVVNLLATGIGALVAFALTRRRA